MSLLPERKCFDCEVTPHLENENRTLKIEVDQLKAENKQLKEALLSINICSATGKKDRTIYMQVHTIPKTHDLIWQLKTESENHDKTGHCDKTVT